MDTKELVERASCAGRTLELLGAEDKRNDKIHDLLETIREQIRTEIEPDQRPAGLMTNIQNTVYAMRGRMRLLDDIAITSPINAAAELASALASQAAEIERLREALKPFADYMAEGMDRNYDGDPLPDADGVGWVYLTQGDFRRARSALDGEKP